MALTAAMGFFLCVIGLPAILGVWVMRLINGELNKDAEFVNPIGIAVGLSVVIAACTVAAISPDAQKELGPSIAYLGFYAAVTFVIGLLIGWADVRNGSKR
jgi:uncharacterized paraquat-inducible protein A